MIDLELLKMELEGFAPNVVRCPKKIEEAYWNGYASYTYYSCHRPEGHDGDCMVNRPILKWPGYDRMKELVDEVERLQDRNRKLRDLLAELAPKLALDTMGEKQ